MAALFSQRPRNLQFPLLGSWREVRRHLVGPLVRRREQCEMLGKGGKNRPAQDPVFSRPPEGSHVSLRDLSTPVCCKVCACKMLVAAFFRTAPNWTQHGRPPPVRDKQALGRTAPRPQDTLSEKQERTTGTCSSVGLPWPSLSRGGEARLRGIHSHNSLYCPSQIFVVFAN